MAKKQSGGRVTANGTQPTKPKGTSRSTGFVPPRSAPGRIDPGNSRSFSGPASSMRSSHHRGNR